MLFPKGIGLTAIEPTLEILFEEAGFHPGGGEQLTMNAQELVARVAVINIAFDGGQDLRQGQFKGDNEGVRHGISLYSNP